jgi:hypothetical protein
MSFDLLYKHTSDNLSLILVKKNAKNVLVIGKNIPYYAASLRFQ